MRQANMWQKLHFQINKPVCDALFTYLLYLLLRLQCLVINAERFLLGLSGLNVIQPVLERLQTFTNLAASQQGAIQLTFSLCQLPKHNITNIRGSGYIESKEEYPWSQWPT